jgi:hypothetical protein
VSTDRPSLSPEAEDRSTRSDSDVASIAGNSNLVDVIPSFLTTIVTIAAQIVFIQSVAFRRPGICLAARAAVRRQRADR